VDEFLTVNIPEDVDPIERGRRFARPLDAALRRAGRLGATVGGGTGMLLTPRGLSVVGCDIELEVKDVARAVPVLRAVLADTRAPAGTIVGHPETDTVLLHVTGRGPRVLARDVPPAPPPPRYPWAVGEVVGYRLTPERLVLLHILGNDHRTLMVAVPDWCGRELPYPDAVRALIARPPERYLLSKLLLFPTGRLGPFPFPVRLRRPRCLSRRRTVRTGVIAERGPLNGLASGASPRWFDRALRQMFGLAPADGKTRLWNDRGQARPHFAAWAAVGAVTPAAARRLFYAFTGGRFRAPPPGRVPPPVTPGLRRFVAALKARHRGDPGVWGLGGGFRPSEGFVVIPAAEGRDGEVWAEMTRLAARYGVTCYDARNDRVFQPRGVGLLAGRKKREARRRAAPLLYGERPKVRPA
jgi:hypothetical protein